MIDIINDFINSMVSIGDKKILQIIYSLEQKACKSLNIEIF